MSTECELFAVVSDEEEIAGLRKTAFNLQKNPQNISIYGSNVNQQSIRKTALKIGIRPLPCGVPEHIPTF